MAKKHPRAYPLEFRAKVVELARAGRRPEDLAAEFELSNQTIRNWIRQADLDAGKRTDGLTSEERTELFMLRKKVKQLTIRRRPSSGKPLHDFPISNYSRKPCNFTLVISARVFLLFVMG